MIKCKKGNVTLKGATDLIAVEAISLAIAAKNVIKVNGTRTTIEKLEDAFDEAGGLFDTLKVSKEEFLDIAKVILGK